MKDQLGDRMKDFYEDRFRYKLPRRTYTIIRIDGKAFHTYTKGLERPFDVGLIEDMNETTKHLCKNIQGVKFGYVQSDEISLLLTDFDDLQTDMWFDGNLQKMCSVAASMATSKFNQLRLIRKCNEEGNDMGVINEDIITKFKMAEFDARIFQISNSFEVENYFIWRQQDATRNSISSVAQSLYSHKELNGKSSNEKQDMIFQKGINWNEYPARMKRGGFIGKVTRELHIQNPIPNTPVVFRSKWEDIECPIFTQDRLFLRSKIPVWWDNNG